MNVTVYIVGPYSLSTDRLQSYLREFRSITVGKIETINRSVPLTSHEYVSDKDAQATFPDGGRDCPAIAVFSVPLEENWFVRYLTNNKIAMTTFDIEGIKIDFWPVEKILSYMILKFAFNSRYLANGGVYSDLYTRNIEDSIYNFSVVKEQAKIGLRSLKVGPRARIALSNAGLTERELRDFEFDLERLKPTFVQKVEKTLKENIWASLLVSFFLGVLASWIANRFP